LVATTNANESRAKDKFFGTMGKADYRTGNDSKAGGYGYKPGENSFKNNKSSGSFEHRPKENAYGNKGSSFRTRDNEYRTPKPGESNTKQVSGFAGTGKSNFTERNRSSYSYSNPKDKDEDSDSKNTRGRRTTEAKARSPQSKELEQTDKLETIKRLEREKKVVQKKNREVEAEKPKRPVLKQKRSTKDWTKDYEYGLLDEEDVF
jgi:hypothetical protein